MTDWRRVERRPEHDEASSAMDGFGTSACEAPEAMQFTKVGEYTTFRAEYGIKDEANLVFHFFATDEINRLQSPWGYWKEIFPRALEKVAVTFFKSGPPELRAAYTEELASWWLQADGAAGKTLDPDTFALRFLAQLDLELERSLHAQHGICTQ